MQASQSITRKSASNLALAFILLPREKRDGMAALYAFCREVDDIADEVEWPVERRRRELAAWRSGLQTLYSGGKPLIPVLQELSPIVSSCKLPYDLFDELIQGVEMDLEINRYETFDTLERYCYRVASVVGLLSIEIFGYSDPRCRDYAVALGKALQLTNILRDVEVDANRGRIYLPQSEMIRCGVPEEDIFCGRYSARYFQLAQSVANRARDFYNTAREILPEVDRRSMASAELMAAVYWKLFQRLERRKFNVFQWGSVRLSKGHKLFLILCSAVRHWTGRPLSAYGTCRRRSRAGR